MADWSFGKLKAGVGGLLSDPDKLTGLLSNPMFSAGMGLLSSRFDGRINPVQAAMQGIAGAQSNKQQQEDRARAEKAREELAALLGYLRATGALPQTPGGAPTAPPAPTSMGGSQLPMSSPFNPMPDAMTAGTVNGIAGPVRAPSSAMSRLMQMYLQRNGLG